MYVIDYPNRRQEKKREKMKENKGVIYISFLIVIITRLEDNEISLVGKDHCFTSDN